MVEALGDALHQSRGEERMAAEFDETAGGTGDLTPEQIREITISSASMGLRAASMRADGSG